MENKLYKQMNWPRIEGIVYSEEDQPQEILGPHAAGKNTLFQTFQPEAREVYLVTEDQKLKMEMVDEAGFYAVLFPGKQPEIYHYEAHYADGVMEETEDAYQYKTEFQKKLADQLNSGILYDSYKYLGAHLLTQMGCEGCMFRIFAPNAIRVSVVGDFNHWDGRRHQMNRNQESGVFELFIPGVKAGASYKYELKTKGSLISLQADPYAFCMQTSPDLTSVVSEQAAYQWQDDQWIKERIKVQKEDQPLSIYEVNLESYQKAPDSFFNYQEIGEILVKECRSLGFTHVQLMPLMKYIQDESSGYQMSNYYAPSADFGNAEDLMKMIDILHQAGIGVILEWSPLNFLWEHDNRPQASNYLIANALYWLEEFHIDGISVTSKIPEDSELFKHINSIIRKKYPGSYLIAQEDAMQAGVTDPLNENGLGFSLKWNRGFVNDLLVYMDFDPYFRSHHHDLLSNSMVYQYSEKHILAIPCHEVREASLRLLYGYVFTHPGKKLLLKDNQMKLDDQLMRLLHDLNVLYQGKAALYQKDGEADGFEWISCMSSEQCMISYLRKSKKEEETLLVVANFAGIKQSFGVGTPLEGKYKEILNTDDSIYGGSSNRQTKAIFVSEKEADGRAFSITIELAALSLAVYSYLPYTKKEKEEIEKKKAENIARYKVQEAKEALTKAKAEAERIRKVYENSLKEVKTAEQVLEEAEEELRKYGTIGVN